MRHVHLSRGGATPCGGNESVNQANSANMWDVLDAADRQISDNTLMVCPSVTHASALSTCVSKALIPSFQCNCDTPISVLPTQTMPITVLPTQTSVRKATIPIFSFAHCLDATNTKKHTVTAPTKQPFSSSVNHAIVTPHTALVADPCSSTKADLNQQDLALPQRQI